jgi:hypothetical protein
VKGLLAWLEFAWGPGSGMGLRFELLLGRGTEVESIDWKRRLTIALVVALGAAAPGSALTLLPTGGGITSTVGNYACANATSAALCPVQKTFDLFQAGTASGSITIDTNTNQATISLSVPLFSFDDVSAPVGGVDEIEFSNVFYSAVVSVVDNGLGSYQQSGGAVNGTVTGTYTQKSLGSTVIAAQLFNETAAFQNLTCPVTGIGQCGLTVGNGVSGSYDLEIGSGPALTKFVNTINISVVPEPATGMLVALGLGALVTRRRTTP